MVNSKFIPVCMYHKGYGDSLQGYLGTPTISIDENGKQILGCGINADGWYYVGRFYAINPMYIPIPSDMNLICAKRSDTAEKSFNTVDVSTTYDPFHLDNSCVYFLGWTIPKPYTTPLFLYNNGNGVVPSFYTSVFPPHHLPVLYVLTDKPMENTIFPGKKNWFEMDENGVPIFRFKSYMGVCIPDVDGGSLEECMVRNDLKNKKPQTLLDYLGKNEDEMDKESELSFFKKNKNLFWIVLVIIFIFCFILVILFLKKKF